MSEYPKQIKNLPRVISFDEFKADTKEGKYAFILNDPIHRKALDILPERKKEYLIQYFTYCNNRHSVEFVISDMYEPYLLVTQIMFSKAKYVVDRFYYIRYIMEVLDKVRIRLQKECNDWWIYTKRYKNGHMKDEVDFKSLSCPFYRVQFKRLST